MFNIIKKFYFFKKNKKKYDVYEVFTPATVAKLTFSKREDAEKDLINALKTPGRQIILFGHSGSGKTTLIKNVLEKLNQKFISTSCEEITTIDDLIKEVLEQLKPYYLMEQQSKKSNHKSSGFSAGSTLINSNIGEESSSEELNTFKRGPVVTTIQSLAKLLAEANTVWVIEDFHKVKNEEKKRLAHVMKIFKDNISDGQKTKIIAIGAVGSPRGILDYNNNLKDRVAEIEVKLMTSEELENIINLGEQLMNIELKSEIKKSIIDLSNGLPSVCHHLCLNMCVDKGILNTSKKNKLSLKRVDLEKAIQKYVAEQSDSFQIILDKVTQERVGDKYNSGELILVEMAKLKETEISAKKLLEKIKNKNPIYPSHLFNKYLILLSGPKLNEVLRYNEHSLKYSFSNQFFKAYVMMKYEYYIKNVINDKIIYNYGNNQIIIQNVSINNDIILNKIHPKRK